MSSTTHRVITKAALLTVLVVLAASCQLERMFPEEVGAGAARLSVRNAVKLISIVKDDANCGMASAAVMQSFRQDGELGQLGSVTWTVENCTVDFGPELVAISEDCNGAKTLARGTLIISATKTVTGILTGNPEKPVIPQAPDAVTFSLSASVRDYELELTDRESVLLMQRADVEVLARVHLAQSLSLGVCSIDTSEVTLDSVSVRDAVYTVDDGEGHVFDVDVPAVDVSGQLGKYDGKENYVEGSITVWDTKVDLNGDHVLDPDYDPAYFQSAFTCREDLKLPYEYVCLPITAKVAEGAAKLTVNNVGNLIGALVDDTSCGFASPDVVEDVEVSGQLGHEGGEALFRIDSPCTLEFPVKTALGRDCQGKTSYAEGTAHVKGTMRLRGRVTGDPAQPIIPTSRDPVELTFDVTFDHFKVSDSESSKSLEILEGSLTGRMAPRMALDASTGACSIATPAVTFSDLAYREGTVALLRKDGNALQLKIDGSSLDAQSGVKDGVENYLEGSIVVDGAPYPIPLEEGSAPILDPEYDGAKFAAGYSCTPNMVPAASEAQCNFRQVIGDGAARLVVQTVGTVAGMVNNDSDCGFEDTFGVLMFPSEVVGDSGDMGSMTWDVEGCTVGADQRVVYSEDCLGGATFVQGHANVNASRTVYGERTTMYLLVDAIEPRDHHDVEITLMDVALDEFVTYQLAAGQSEPIGKLTIHEGTLSALVEPATGARADEPETMDVPTPIARLSQIHLRNARATLEAQGKVFEIAIADTSLSATNGTFDAVTNSINGTIMIDGNAVTIGGPLNPAYNASQFEQSYVCTENLAGPVR
ncbi:MAG: hypothetical protein A2138_22045 [Deltaproteobacteria bacterium RBG_16_71_12]|nr:MAG: hypothetical protein A2138_22045 [Deltaproteobacteria bacterium RBG_16_71_12]